MATTTSTSDHINLHLSCHCRTFTSIITLPKTAFPLKSAICHCSMCRHSTGHIFATFAVIPLPDKPDCEGLTGFSSSESLTRWFCSTCACSIWNDDRGGREWELATGVISGVTCGEASVADISSGASGGPLVSRGPGSPEGMGPGMNTIDGLLDRVQMWLGSTGDGGAAVYINGGKLEGMQRHLEGRHSDTVDDSTLDSMVQSARSKLRDIAKSSTKIAARCACEQIKINISRPDPTTKYVAGIDACWSCRKTTGAEITSWITVPKTCFSWADGRPITFDEEVLGKYKTSAELTRYFCTGCGVQVFCLIGERETWDFSMGLLESEHEGTRFEGWFEWTKYADRVGGVAWIEDALDRTFVNGLVEGVQRDNGKQWTSD